MPTYLYECKDCGEFEDYHSMSFVHVKCPKCIEGGKSEADASEVQRLICSTTKGVVELSGQDIVDKHNADVAQLKRDMNKSEKVYSNMLGESKYQSLQQRIDRQKRR